MAFRSPRTCSRRQFLKWTASVGGSVALPTLLPASVFGSRAPSHRIALGCIGVGRMGRDDMREFMGFDEIQVVAVCDVDAARAQAARDMVLQTPQAKAQDGATRGCDVVEDFRELVAREDIDAVMISTPDHWHALPALAAIRAGKDVFVQKPLTLTIEEGRALSDEARRHQRVLLVGSQQRSDQRFRFACELVRNGRIGPVQRVRVGVGTDPATGVRPAMPVPENLNYDMWLGPAQEAPYTEDRVHPQKGYGRPGWLRISDYGAGMVTGWGAHHMDIAHWGLGVERTGPIEIEGKGEFPKDGLWDVHGLFEIHYKYANGAEVVFADSRKVEDGVRFEGPEGWVHVNRGVIKTHPETLVKSTIRPDEIHLYESVSHKGNFIECVRSRAETVAPVEVGHRSCTACLLGDIAMRLGRKLRWDPDQERFIDDEEAHRRIARPMRPPWHL